MFDAYSDQSWCRVQKSSTFNHYFLYNAITISVEPSSELSEETANVTLKTVYGKEIAIKVTRAGAEPVLSAEMNTKDITPDAQTFQIGINTNYDPSDLQVSSSNDWFSVKIVDGTDGTRARATQIKYIGENYTTRAGSNNSAAKFYYLEVTAKSNYNTTARQGTITVKGKDGKKSANISINQQNAELSMENNTLSLTARGMTSNTQSFNTNINSENLQISSNASWCNVWLKEDENGKFYYSVTANTTGAERQAKITIKPKEGNLSSLNITINQSLPIIYFSKDTLWFDKNNGNQTITITDDLGNWSVENSSASWCTFTKNGNTLYVRVNATVEDREATISFNGYNKTLNIVQSKYACRDSYKEGNITGTVCYMKDGIRIIYNELGKYCWSTENIITGANSRNDGHYNMEKIKQITNWHSLYPAFAACDSLNNEQKTNKWYIPSSNEAKEYFGNPLSWYYLTSTESDESHCIIYSRGQMREREKISKEILENSGGYWVSYALITCAILKF